MNCGVREIFNTAVLTLRAEARRDQERHAAVLSGTGQVSPLKLSSESLFAFIKCLLGYRNKDFPIGKGWIRKERQIKLF